MITFVRVAEGYAIFDEDPENPKALKLGIYATKFYKGIRKDEGKDPIAMYEPSPKRTIHFTSPIVSEDDLKAIVAALPADPGI
jgi:hypothetical protein